MESLIKFSGTETINEDLYTNSLITAFEYLITLKSKLERTTINNEKNTNVSNENFC